MIELRSDQREVAKRLVEVLKTHPVVGLQAPTGWGKTIVALEVIKELSVKALWLTPRLSIGVHVFHHCGALGLRCLATAGREKMCSFGYSSLDFARGVCHRCGLNQSRVSIGELDRLILGSLDFGKVKEAAEQLRICPYKLQTLIEGMGDYDVVIAHYNRARKLVNALRPRLIIADEVHNVALPIIHRVNTKELRFLLEKLGFEEDEALGLVRSPETLRALLQEMVDSLIYVIDEDGEARPIVEELVEMLGSSIWYYDESEDAVVGLEVPELPRTDAKMLLMSATLPPSLASDPNVITVRRGWAVPVRIDSKYVLTYENVRKRREEIGRYVAERYLRPSTVVFTTTAREDLLLLNNKDGIIWEDELEGRTPCDFKNETVVLRAYGRYAEGINLDCFDNLVLLGLPALQPTAMHRLEARGINPRDLIITKLVQIIGRVIRSPTPPDRMPNIYLVDKRFHQFESELKNYEIEIINA